MKVLHLNTHASGGSYECAALLSTALAEQGIESRVLCKGSQLPESVGVLLDRVIRRSYVSSAAVRAFARSGCGASAHGG